MFVADEAEPPLEPALRMSLRSHLCDTRAEGIVMHTAQETSVRLALASLAVVAAIGCGQTAGGRTVTVTMHHISAEGVGAEAGTVTIAETAEGLLLTPNLRGFRPGFHAFHAHENPSCEPAVGVSGKMESGRAGGPHYNGPAGQPAATSMPADMTMEGMDMKMEGMEGMKMEGMEMPAARMVMRGDFPQLTAAADGTITSPVVKIGLPLDEILNRAIMMHPYGEEGQDPERPTDGTATIRIACGILPR
jgi:Cu-Zn family superoxide dismutase